MRYVDGFVIPLPKNKEDEYRKLAAKAGKIWMKYGALEYVECIGEDLHPEGMPGMPIFTFTKLAKTKPNETVLFSFIIFKSRKHRDEVNKKVMKDPFMNDPKNTEKPMPFDMKRMAYGGFRSLVDL